MHYYICVNGKITSKPLTKEKAEKVLGKLRGTILGIDIMESDEDVVHIAAWKRKMKLVKRNVKFEDIW